MNSTTDSSGSSSPSSLGDTSSTDPSDNSLSSSPPHVWERDMIVRSFFSKYGLVTGVSMIGYTSGKLLRYVISFKDPNPAMDLIGSWIKILSATVWVREVTGETIFPM